MDKEKFQNAKVPTLEPLDVALIPPPNGQLKCWQGWASPMARNHQHDDIEVNLVSDAPLKYLFGGTPVEVQAGQMSIFWATMPHRVIDRPERSYVCWIHIPLRTVLSWQLPDVVVSSLLRGTPLVCSADGSAFPDRGDFAQWSRDLADGSAQLRASASLEIQALMLRLVHRATSTDDEIHDWSDPHDALRHVAAMASYAATSFREPITATDVAATTHLHPTYAMTLFRRTVGTPLSAFLTQCRVAEAQRLLITTTDTTSDIAMAAGFSSQSGFYATFTRHCGQSPGAYRRAYRKLDTLPSARTGSQKR